ncbi:hypothetical protein PBN151_1327 [Paenibacillus sp. NAIST15-1]|nr:hypothetical protein PBN151_1327 [Paenibacillus sp. NAIST15-1]
MTININKPSCYELKLFITKGTLLIANTSEFDLTEGRIYAAMRNQGDSTFGDCIFIKNNKGNVEDYTLENFCLYEGEIVSQ